MSKKYLKSIYRGLFLSLIVFLAGPSVSRASQSELEDQLETAGVIGWGYIAEPTTLADIIQYAISAFLGLLGVIFLVLIIYAGYNWMLARGDEEKVTMAKNTLARAVVGLIIILAAYSITFFVFSSLSKTGGSGPVGGSGQCADGTAPPC